MGLVDIVLILVIAAIVGGAALYIRKAKKSGKKCIGCPHSGTCGSCSGNCSGCSGSCGCEGTAKK